MTKIRHQITIPIDAIRKALTEIELSIPGSVEEIFNALKQFEKAEAALKEIHKHITTEIAYGASE